MNWNAKERSEIALNRIWSEHVEKEKLYMKPKTKYTCNPCPSIDMNNGLGSRGARASIARPESRADPRDRSTPRPARARRTADFALLMSATSSA